MQNNTMRKESSSYTSFADLGGIVVSKEVVFEEISRMPLYAVLSYLSSLSVQFIEYPELNKPDFLDPKRQGEYLNLAIVDDFPCKLPNAEKMYAPGRVPYTRGKYIFIHSHNIAFLANAALSLYDKTKVNYELDYELPRRMCRLLLITNDFLGDKQHLPAKAGLREKRHFVISWLRQWQFNKYQRWYVPWTNLARCYKIYTELLPKYFPIINKRFQDISGGVTISRYFLVLAHIVAHFYRLTPNKLWLDIKTLFKDIAKNEQEYFERLILQWSCTPQIYSEELDKWRCERRKRLKYDNQIFDYVILKRKPLIEAIENRLICPVVEFLIDKIVDEPFFLFSDELSDKERDEYHRDLGLAYEEYANNLIEKISKNDLKGKWDFIPKPLNKKNEELSDCLLQRDGIVFCFEHKGGRLFTDFLLGGNDSGRVLGPKDVLLEKIDKGNIASKEEVRNGDNGVLTEGIWQQDIHFEDIVRYMKEHSVETKKFFPVITFMARVKIDQVCHKGYLEELIRKAGLYREEAYVYPQWLNVEDLESLMYLAENNLLDLKDLFLEKSLEQNRSIRFDWYLARRYPNMNLYSKEQRDLVIKLIKCAEQDFVSSHN